MHGGGRTAKRTRRAEAENTVAVLSRSSQRALRSTRSVRRTERRQRDVQFARSHFYIAGGGKDLVQQRPAFLLGTRVVRLQEIQQIAFGFGKRAS